MERQMTFDEIEPTFSGPGLIDNNYIIVSNEIARELLRITPTGQVIAPTLEAASDAGKAFVDAIRNNWKNT